MITVPVSAFEKGTAIATIPVGSAAAEVALTPDGKLAYVANVLDGTGSVIYTGNWTSLPA